jgi:hypothetical protein
LQLREEALDGAVVLSEALDSVHEDSEVKSHRLENDFPLILNKIHCLRIHSMTFKMALNHESHDPCTSDIN